MILEANRQLANAKYYRSIENSIQQNTQIQVRSIVSKLYSKKYITAKQRDFLYGPDEPRNRQFYLPSTARRSTKIRRRGQYQM